MAILNFPTNPALDQTYIVNNVIYTWNGEYWEANSTNGFDSRYVEVSGDNMTGDLTLGTDKITLDATDGSITAAGDAQIGADPNISSTVGGVKAYGAGAVDLFRASTNDRNSIITALSLAGVGGTKTKVFSVDVDGEVRIGGDIDASPNFRVQATGNVRIGGLPSAPNITLNADGSAQFAGPVFTDDAFLKRYSSADPVTNAYVVFDENSVADYVVKTDGEVMVGGINLTSSSPVPNISLKSNGSILCGSDTSAASLQIKSAAAVGTNYAITSDAAGVTTFRLDSNGTISLSDSNTTKTQLFPDGTATFAGGTSDAPGVFIGKNNSNGVYPSLYLQQDNADGNFLTCKNGFSGALTARIGADGSAEFKDMVTVPKILAIASGINCFYDSGKIAHDHANFYVVQGSDIGVHLPSGQTVWQPTTSERRLKENIEEIDSDIAWETIKSTPYYSYNFIGTEATNFGPMADEVPAEMVVQPMETVIIDEAVEQVIGPKGKILKEGKEAVTEQRPRSDAEGPIRTYDNGMLQARLYTALQTALTRIETLEAKVASLENPTSTADI